MIRLPFESRGEKTNDRFLGHDEMRQKLKVIEERDRRLKRERFWNLIEICRLKTRVKTLVEKGKESAARGSLPETAFAIRASELFLRSCSSDEKDMPRAARQLGLWIVVRLLYVALAMVTTMCSCSCS